MRPDPVPFPPAFLIPGSDGHLVVGVDGEMTWADVDSLATRTQPAHPFPGEVSHAIPLADDRWVCTWVDRELSIARMAAFEADAIRDGFGTGPTREELRQLEGGALDDAQVEGALWSHVLDAEPLALSPCDGDMVFINHTRGLYRIGPDASEKWRASLPRWPLLAPLPGGEVIVHLEYVDDVLHAFSLAGGHATIDPESGEVLTSEILEVEAKIEQVWHADGEWLLGLSHQRMARWRPGQDHALEVRHVEGPVQAALHDGEAWAIAGWREDLYWGREGLISSRRSDLGIGLAQHPKLGLMVLSNSGDWSAFRGSSKSQNG